MDIAEITEERLAALVPAFYARVRNDPLIGPLFNAAVHDWAEHLEKLTAFWSSVMLTTGRYKGSPMAAHLRHVDAITPAMTNMDTDLDFSRCGISRHLKDNSRRWIGKPEED